MGIKAMGFVGHMWFLSYIIICGFVLAVVGDGQWGGGGWWVLGTFCDKDQKCKISPNLSLGSLEVFICWESSLKLQMYNEQKVIGALIIEKSKCQ